MCAAQTAIKQPAVFVAHGGGPLPLLNHPSHKGLTSWLQDFPALLKSSPKAILVISAHWEVRHSVSELAISFHLEDLPLPPDSRQRTCLLLLLVSGGLYLQEKQPTITSGAAPPLIYDYYGFPSESYTITYPAPGSPKLAEHAAELLRYIALSHAVSLFFDPATHHSSRGA